MSDTRHSDNNNDLYDEKKSNMSDEKYSKGKTLRKWLLDKDIRLVLLGNNHNQPYTQIPIELVEALLPNLKRIFLEAVNVYDTHDPAKEHHRFQDKVRDWLANKASSTKSYTRAQELVVLLHDNGKLGALSGYGMDNHQYTYQTLFKSAQSLKSKEIMLVDIGQAHLAGLDNTMLKEDKLYHGPLLEKTSDYDKLISGDYDNDSSEDDEPDNDNQPQSLVEIERSNWKKANLIKSEEGVLPLESFCLLEKFNQKLNYGILVIDGRWWTGSDKISDYKQDDWAYAIQRHIDTVFELLKQFNGKNLYYAKNYHEWDQPYFNPVITDKGLLDLFSKFAEFGITAIQNIVSDHFNTEISQFKQVKEDRKDAFDRLMQELDTFGMANMEGEVEKHTNDEMQKKYNWTGQSLLYLSSETRDKWGKAFEQQVAFFVPELEDLAKEFADADDNADQANDEDGTNE